jgi:hypothetical protein
MSKRKALIKALIHFHWKNIVKDNARIGVTEMKKRMAVISGLRALIAEPHRKISTRKKKKQLTP